MRRWPVVVAWLATRAFVVLLLCTSERMVTGDPAYYRDSLVQLPSLGVAHTLVEYPVPALVLLDAPYRLLGLLGLGGAYVGAIAACGLATDAALGWALVRARTWRPDDQAWLAIRPAEWVWLLAVPALGATTYARFDLVPGILVGLALLYAAHRPRVAAVVGALATGAKYWPAIVLPALLAPRRSRLGVLVTTVGCGLVLAAGSAALGGWHRLWTPLSYLQDRGLQIESVAAAPAMLGYAHDPGSYTVTYASSHAYEVTGPLVAGLLRVSTIATIVLAVLLLALWAWAWRRLDEPESGGSVDAIVWLVLASVTGFVVTGKVLSPQYLLWLLPAAAAGLAVVRDRQSRQLLLLWSVALLATAVATQVIFPLRYADLLGYGSHTTGVVLLLTARNLGLVVLLVSAFTEAIRLLYALGSDHDPSRRYSDRRLRRGRLRA